MITDQGPVAQYTQGIYYLRGNSRGIPLGYTELLHPFILTLPHLECIMFNKIRSCSISINSRVAYKNSYTYSISHNNQSFLYFIILLKKLKSTPNEDDLTDVKTQQKREP